MAGSYSHIVTNDGNLIDIVDLTTVIENLGDAYDAIEEMYGMIWWLASMGPDAPPMLPEALVELARQHSKLGLELAKTYIHKRQSA